MPLWLIYHPEGTFEDASVKRSFSQDITSIYTKAGLPAFYVVVNFIKLRGSDTYIGGHANTGNNPFVRIAIDHIAVRQPDDDAAYRSVRNRIDQILKPYIADKGYDWEFHVGETERRLWRIQGIDPPPFKSEQERVWFEMNKAVAWK